MTTQSCISGQSFGTGSNVGNGKFSITPKTLSSGTTAFLVNVQVTPGAGPVDTKLEVRVWYTTTIRTVAAADAPYKLGQTARYVDKKIGGSGDNAIQVSVPSSKDSSLEPVTGTLFHCWVDAPALATAATLDVDIVELP